jgi:hypothetical protein
MAIDNRTTLNDCSATTGWSGDDTVSVITLTGQFYEGAAGLSMQFSDSDEHMFTTNIGGTRNLSAATVYMLAKDNLVASQVNGGMKIVLSDGTDTIGYEIGGSDNMGIPLDKNFFSFKLDVSNSATFTPFPFSGSEAALSKTAVTGVGIGAFHLSKAQGAIDNCFVDRLSFIANGNPALTINGGTVGTPQTFGLVSLDDITSGWGLVSNPQGKQFNIFAPIEIGTTVAATDSYFAQTDSQIFLNGTGMTDGNMFVNIVGGTGTNSVTLSNCIFVSTGSPAVINMSSASNNILQIENSQFVDCGAITLPAQSVGNKFITSTSFINCGQVDPSTLDLDIITFNGTRDPNGALLLDEATSSNMTELNFDSDGTGHAIYIRPTGAGPFSYTFDNWSFNGYGADATTNAVAYVNPVTLSANVTINIINGGTGVTVRTAAGYTGTVTINSAVAVSVTGVTEGTSVKIVADETVGTITTGDIILEAVADATGAATTSINYEGAFDPSGLGVVVRARSSGICLAAFQDDGGVFTDYTSESNTSATADMILAPATPSVNDAFYFGHFTTFNGAKLEINTPTGASSLTLAWEYYNGGWVSLSGVTDGSVGYSVSGENKITWPSPSGWTQLVVNGSNSYYYVRARITAVGGGYVQPTARKVTLNVQRYLPYSAKRVISGSGLADIAVWVPDTIAKF